MRHRATPSTLVLIGLIATLVAGAASGSEWPGFRGPRFDGSADGSLADAAGGTTLSVAPGSRTVVRCSVAIPGPRATIGSQFHFASAVVVADELPLLGRILGRGMNDHALLR